MYTLYQRMLKKINCNEKYKKEIVVTDKNHIKK